VVNKEFWKERYKDKWEDGNRREKMAVDLFEKFGIKLEPYGFEALSKEYNKNSPEERGKPDFYADIHGEKIYFEVTGTDSPKTKEKDDLWVRPDKAEYVKKHKIKAYCVHILDKLGIIRFVKMDIVSESPIKEIPIRGTIETFHTIKADKALSISQFKEELKIK